MNENNSVWKGFLNFSEFKSSKSSNVVPNGSMTRWPIVISSIENGVLTKVKTSKYQKILSEYYSKFGFNESNRQSQQQTNETSNGMLTEKSNKILALTLPLLILALFLTFVAICHRYDSVKTKRNRNKNTGRSTNNWKNEAEHAVEEIAKEPETVPVELQRVNWLVNQKRNKMLQNYGMDCRNRCICKLVCCPHCMGYETKRLQWKDLVDANDAKHQENLFHCKNASTQTWMPIVYRMKKVPQSSQYESNVRLPSSIRPHFVEPESVFDSEVSSKPHFPSSASNYAESIKEVSESFYYSAASGNSISVFQETNQTIQYDEKGSKMRHSRLKGRKKSHRSEAQLLSADEDWL